MARFSTGVSGLDSLIEGGILDGSVILLSGTAGTGKTIFCLQFVCLGAMSAKEKGVYFTLEESSGKKGS